MPTTSTFIRSIVGIFSTPIEETLDALDTLVRAGKVRYLGASSMAAWQFSKALYLAKQNGWHRFVAMQNHYNLCKIITT
jgi:aryl-alcohol dehydrogenase (NADP+)